MRILMLSNPDATHTLKWVNGLAQRQIEVMLLGVQKPQLNHYETGRYLQVADAGVPTWITRQGEGSWAKLFYLKAVKRVRDLVREWKPDLVHAHYVSSYGLIGALSRRHPLFVSVWGSDIYEFPDRSPWNRKMVEYALAKADKISSTSHVMAKRTQLFTQKSVDVIPFGIDLDHFTPKTVARPFALSDIVIGTVKTMNEKYGIRYLVEAFAILKQRHPMLPLKLLLVGGGPQENEMRALVRQLGLNKHTHFTGFVPADRVPIYHNMLDIYVAVSTADSESFGVAIIEAGACGKPVVVSDAGGLPEVVEAGTTGFVVPRRNATATADAIETFLLYPELLDQMGQAGRKRVTRLYDLERNLDQMIQVYRDLASKSDATAVPSGANASSAQAPTGSNKSE